MTMIKNRVARIHTEHQQSIWLDFIDRDILRSGKLRRLIATDGIRSVTSNPAIFAQAIAASADYDADIRSVEAADAETIFYGIAIQDIRAAADLFAPLYGEQVAGADGYVSLEVSPLLALDGEGTLAQARTLWAQVDRKNLMVKIPATLPGLTAIRKAISEGINVNVTLIFGLERYAAVAEAYLAGLEDRLRTGADLRGVASVASFFLSRIDLATDPLLVEKGHPELQGQAAIASAKAAYALYRRLFSGERWAKLAAAGAQPQRLLWASTGNKDPKYKDTRYVEELIGPDTVNTLPLATLDAFRAHGEVAGRLESGTEQALSTLEAIGRAGIDLTAIAGQLETEGIDKFGAPYRELLDAIREKRR